MSSPPQPLQPGEALDYGRFLVDCPENLIAIHALRTARCRAYRLRGAFIVDPFLTPGELLAFGDNPADIWKLLEALPGWTCVEVAPPLAESLATRMERETGAQVVRYDDVFYQLDVPVSDLPHPSVRLLTADDAELYARCAAAFGDDPGDARRNLLEGPVAAAIVDGDVVAAVEANVRTSRLGNLTAETLPAYRNQRLCTAAAALAARALQSLAITPVWSAGEGNIASRHIAQKLGFVEVSRTVYLSLKAR